MWLLSVFFFSLSGCKYNRVKLCYNKVHFVKEAQDTTASNAKWRAKLRRSQDFLLILCQRFLVPQLWDRYPNIIELASWLVHVLFDFMIMKIYLTDDIFTFWVKTLLLSFHYILGVYIFRYTFTKPKLIAFFFFYQSFLSRTRMTHRTAGDGRGPFFIPLYRFHPLTIIQTFICNCACEMTIIFLIATLVFTRLLLDAILPLYRITIWLIHEVKFFLVCLLDDLILGFCFNRLDTGNQWTQTRLDDHPCITSQPTNQVG